MVELSAKSGQGVDALLDAISLQSEVLELQAVAEGRATGVVIESSLDKGRGPVATVLVQQGQLAKGDYLVCGVQYGRVRALFDENGKQVPSAGPRAEEPTSELQSIMRSSYAVFCLNKKNKQ